VPTKHRRRAITETPPVKTALARLHAEFGGGRIDLGELVVLGADAKLTALRAEREDRAAGLRRLADRIRSRDLRMDLEAAEEVRATGWVRQ
jgi:hypothetical protein